MSSSEANAEAFYTKKLHADGDLSGIILQLDYAYRHLESLVSDSFYDVLCRQAVELGEKSGCYWELIKDGVSAGFMGLKREDYPPSARQRAWLMTRLVAADAVGPDGTVDRKKFHIVGL